MIWPRAGGCSRTCWRWRGRSRSSGLLRSEGIADLVLGQGVAAHGEEARDVLADQIGFEVHPRAWFLLANRGADLGLGDQRYRKLVVGHRVHGQADSVDGHRAFLDEERRELLRH